MKQLDLLSYQTVNESFRKRMIFRVGIDCGLFVEMNHLINAMLYFLAHSIKFQLYSKDANFGTGAGWTEYFQPFCDEVQETFHKKYNYHRLPTWRRIFKLCRIQKSPGPIAWKLKSIAKNCIGHLLAFKAYKEFVLLTQDVPFEPDKHYVISELGINCSYYEAYKLLARMIWRFQPEIEQDKLSYLERLNLPAIYDGIQIRGGDKVKESNLISGIHVMQKLNPENGSTVFILTDDYRQMKILQSKYPYLTLLTTCQKEEAGYNHKEFSKSSPSEKKKAITRLLISVDLLLNSRRFVGSITTGPSVFIMKQRIDDLQSQAVDCPKDELASTLLLTIDTRAAISSRNMQTELTNHLCVFQYQSVESVG